LSVNQYLLSNYLLARPNQCLLVERVLVSKSVLVGGAVLVDERYCCKSSTCWWNGVLVGEQCLLVDPVVVGGRSSW
jgi:hypothetical protein